MRQSKPFNSAAVVHVHQFVAITLSLMEVLTPNTEHWYITPAGSCFVVLIAPLLYDRKSE